MAHPLMGMLPQMGERVQNYGRMGELIQNYRLGERVRGYGMGERVQNYGELIQNYPMSGYLTDGADFGSVDFTPGPGVLMGSAQLGFSFDDILNSIGDSLSSGFDKAKNQAIANTLQTLVKDPTVQTAIVESGNDAAIQSLAQQLKNAQTKVITTVKANPYTTLIVLGAAGVGLFLLIRAMRR